MKTLHRYAGRHRTGRLDPRVKLLCSLGMLFMVVSSRGTLFPLAVAASSLGCILCSGVRARTVLVCLAQPLFMAAVVLVLKLFTGHEPLFSWSWGHLSVVIHGDGLREGVQVATRILGAVSVVLLLGRTTSFTELMGALAWLRVPRSLVDVSLFAWRYLFVLFDDAMVIYHSQKNRLGYAGYRRGLHSFGALTGALVIKAFDSSQNMTTAMVQRGYDGTLPLAGQKPLRWAEVGLSLLILTAGALLWRL